MHANWLIIIIKSFSLFSLVKLPTLIVYLENIKICNLNIMDELSMKSTFQHNTGWYVSIIFVIQFFATSGAEITPFSFNWCICLTWYMDLFITGRDVNRKRLMSEWMNGGDEGATFPFSSH